MATKCKECKYWQYCEDCKKETQEEQVFTIMAQPIKNHRRNNKCLFINGSTLYHKGRPFHITGITQGDPNNVIATKEGFVFYTRKKDGKEYLIKVQHIEKNGKKPDCVECQDIYFGLTPKGLIADPSW